MLISWSRMAIEWGICDLSQGLNLDNYKWVSSLRNVPE
jgi:hypothetical protein